MEPLDVEARLEYARATVAVIRGLKITDRRMRYNELARAIGLLPEGAPWEVRYRTHITHILCIAAAVENQAGAHTPTAPLEFERIVNEEGEPGAGFLKTSRIVRA